MIELHSTYKLDDYFLKCIRVRRNGLNVFQVSDQAGVIKPPIRAKNGFITDYGTRLVSLRTDELILINQNMRTLTEFEVDMIELISHHTPYSQVEVTRVFLNVESWDKTLYCLRKSIQLALLPDDLFELIEK